MPTYSIGDGAAAAGSGIGKLFSAFMGAKYERDKAQADAALLGAQTYYNNMRGNKYGAEAEGQQLTNTARTSPLPADMSPDDRRAATLWQMGMSGNVDQVLSGAQRAQQMRYTDAAALHPALAPTLGMAIAAGSGKGWNSAVGDTGVSVNQFTGRQDTAHSGLYGLHGSVEGSQAAKNVQEAFRAAEQGKMYGQHGNLYGLQAQGQILDNQGAAMGLSAAGLGQPDPRTIPHPTQTRAGGDVAAMTKARAAVVTKAIADGYTPEQIAEQVALFDNFAMTGGVPAAAALPQPAAAPTAAPAQGGAGKMATMDQVRQIAAAKGLKQTQVIDGLKKAGYTIR